MAERLARTLAALVRELALIQAAEYTMPKRHRRSAKSSSMSKVGVTRGNAPYPLAASARSRPLIERNMATPGPRRNSPAAVRASIVGSGRCTGDSA